LAARKCAWAERLAMKAGLNPTHQNVGLFGGSAMLTVLYANGEGVEPNLGLAARFSCEARGASAAEISGRLGHLASMEDAPAGGDRPKFQYCDDITSGYMTGACAGYYEELAEQKRSDELAAFSSAWPAPQHAGMAALVKAERAYAQAHEGEINISGTMRAALMTAAAESLRDDFLAALKFFETNPPPRGSAADFAAADAKLNDLYRKVLASAKEHETGYGAVQPENIRKAQTAWLTYRDAWARFAASHYAGTPDSAWLTLLTEDRIAILKDTACEVAWDEPSCKSEDKEADSHPRPRP
jgi:uncharacterized protein YecT (DUF1311 family)